MTHSLPRVLGLATGMTYLYCPLICDAREKMAHRGHLFPHPCALRGPTFSPAMPQEVLQTAGMFTESVAVGREVGFSETEAIYRASFFSPKSTQPN
jgi:hypothetical protein